MLEQRMSSLARELVTARLISGIISVNQTSRALKEELSERLRDFIHEPSLGHGPLSELPTLYCLPPREIDRCREIMAEILRPHIKTLERVNARILMQLSGEIEKQFPHKLVIDQSPDRYFLLARTRRYFLWVQALMGYTKELRGAERLNATKAILAHVDFRKALLVVMKYVPNTESQARRILDCTSETPIYGLLDGLSPQDTNQAVIDLGIVLRRVEETLSLYERERPQFDLGHEIARMMWIQIGHAQADIPTSTHSLMGGMRNRIEEIVHLKLRSRASTVARIFQNDFRLMRFTPESTRSNLSATAHALREISSELAYLTHDHAIKPMRRDKAAIWLEGMGRLLKVPLEDTELDLTPLLSFALESGDMRKVRNACLSIALYLEGTVSSDALLVSSEDIKKQCHRLLELAKRF